MDEAKVKEILQDAWAHGEEHQKGTYHPLSRMEYIDLWCKEICQLEECPRCLGTGRILTEENTDKLNFARPYPACPVCKGTGQVPKKPIVKLRRLTDEEAYCY